MENILQKLNLHFKDKFSYLKLYEVIFLRQNKLVEIKLLYPFNIEIDESDKEEISSFITKTLNLNSKVVVKFKKSYLDENIIRQELLDYIKKFHSSVFTFLKNEDVEILRNEFFIAIKIKLSEKLFQLYKNKNLEENIKKHMEKNFISEFDVKLLEHDDEIDTESFIQCEQKKIFESHLNQKKTPRYNIEEVDLIFGKEIDPAPEFIKNITCEKTSVILAGNILNFEKKEYLSKKGKTAGTTKFYYAFVLDDTTAKIDVRYFASKQNIEKMDKLFNGGQVAIVGDVREFNKKFTLYVNSIAYCKLPEKVEYKKEEVVVSEECIKPEPYKIVKQENLLVSEKPLPEEVIKTNYVVFDTETTGLDYEKDEIIEIGAVKIVGGVIVEQFQTLVKPHQEIPAEATAINNITNEMVACAPSGERVIKDFYTWAKDCTLVAYNIAFDIKFIQALAKKSGLYFDNPNLDALALAKSKLKLSRYKLSDVVKRLNVTLNNAHRALADTVATAEAFLIMMREDY